MHVTHFWKVVNDQVNGWKQKYFYLYLYLLSPPSLYLINRLCTFAPCERSLLNVNLTKNVLQGWKNDGTGKAAAAAATTTRLQSHITGREWRKVAQTIFLVQRLPILGNGSAQTIRRWRRGESVAERIRTDSRCNWNLARPCDAAATTTAADNRALL